MDVFGRALLGGVLVEAEFILFHSHSHSYGFFDVAMDHKSIP